MPKPSPFYFTLFYCVPETCFNMETTVCFQRTAGKSHENCNYNNYKELKQLLGTFYYCFWLSRGKTEQRKIKMCSQPQVKHLKESCKQAGSNSFRVIHLSEKRQKKIIINVKQCSRRSPTENILWGLQSDLQQ